MKKTLEGKCYRCPRDGVTWYVQRFDRARGYTSAEALRTTDAHPVGEVKETSGTAVPGLEPGIQDETGAFVADVQEATGGSAPSESGCGSRPSPAEVTESLSGLSDRSGEGARDQRVLDYVHNACEWRVMAALTKGTER